MTGNKDEEKGMKKNWQLLTGKGIRGETMHSGNRSKMG
jgi:hypothetical protein